MLNQDYSRKESQQQQRSSEECEQAGGILRFLLAADRKYDQIMSSDHQNDPLEGHFDLITALGNSSASQHKRKSDVGEEYRKSNKKRFKTSCGNGGPGGRIVLRSSASPGSNSSDVTTEQYMAESSKSSCFDDACTLPADQVSGTASTSHSHHEQQLALKSFSESLDLNGSPDLMRRSTTRTATTTVGLELLHHDNKDVELEDDRRRAPELEGGKNAEYFNSNWQDSWLQLGLGPSSRSPNVLRKPHENTEEYLAAARAEEEDEDDQVDVSRQRNKALLHLFPSESVQIPEQDTEQPEQLPARHVPATSSHQATRRASAAADESMGTGGFYGSVPPVRFGRAERSEQEFTGFLKSLREGPPPDTQLVIPYQSNNVNTTADHRHPASTRFNMFGELHPPSSSSAFHESSEPGAAFHAGYNPPPPPLPPPGYESLGFQFEDSKQFMRSGKRAMQQDQYGPSYSWKHETSRPEISFGSASNLHSVVPSRLNMPPSQPPEDWQTLIKRLGGGGLQFQSLFPNVTKGGATSSEALDHDMQRRRNLHDFQWSNAGQGETTGGRGGSSSWSRQLFGGGGHQEMKAPVPGFQFSSFQDKPSLWQPSAGLLPFLPPGMQQQQHQVDQYHQHHFKDPRRSKPGRLSKSDPQQEQQQQQQHDLWFFLRAGAANQDSERLPQIPKGYLRVKDGSVPVSHVKKYLVHKLGLSCESEVEISCRGQILLSSLSLQHVRDVIWYSVSEREELPSTGKNIVMELSYCKRFAR